MSIATILLAFLLIAVATVLAIAAILTRAAVAAVRLRAARQRVHVRRWEPQQARRHAPLYRLQ